MNEDESENQGLAETEKEHVGSEYTMVSTKKRQIDIVVEFATVIFFCVQIIMVVVGNP
jgi:lipopolysaccharide/colanic/teichoic acid biosynthesis glycosyltransferase